MNRHDNTLAHDESDAIPTGWHEFPVKKLIEKHFCGPSPDCDERPIQTEQEWGVLKTSAIEWKGWNESAHKTLPRKYWGLEHLQVQQGDVLITKAGPRDRVAVVAHVTSNPRRIIVSGKMIALRPRRDAVVSQVLSRVLGLRRTQDYIHARTTGMAESQVNFANGVVLDASVRVPVEIAEQSRIAEILDAVDSAIREVEAAVSKLRQVRAGLLQDLLTRGLDEHGHLRDPARHPEQFQDSPIGRIPKAWQCPTIGDITSHVGSGSTPRGGSAIYRKDGITFVRSQNVTFDGLLLDDVVFISPAIHAAMSRSEIFPFDVLLNITGASIGRCCFVPTDFGPANVNQHVCALRIPKPRFEDGVFLSAVLASHIGQAQIDRLNAGGNREGLNYTQVRSFFVPWPEPDERKAIAERLQQAKTRLEVEESQLSKLHSLKCGLAHDLLTGRVRVNRNPIHEGFK